MNEEMNGLAAQGMQEQGMGGRQGEMDQMIAQVARLIMQGATPEDLLKMGVPQEVIEMAMQLVNSQQGSVAGPTQNAGLAGSQL